MEKIGGSSYLASLVATKILQPDSSTTQKSSRKSTFAETIHAATEILEAGYNEGDDIEKILDEAEQKLFAVSQKYIKQDFVPIRSILKPLLIGLTNCIATETNSAAFRPALPHFRQCFGGLQKSGS